MTLDLRPRCKGVHEELGVSGSAGRTGNLGGAGKSLGVEDGVAEGEGGMGVEVRKE